MITQFFFAFFTLATIGGAVLTVTLRNPIQCGLALLSVLLNMAGFFILLHAEFIAAVQVIVYAGAILVLYLFVLMLLNLKAEERYFHRRWALLLFFGLVILGQLVWALLQAPFAGRLGAVTAEQVIAFGHSQSLGITIFNDFFLPFEIIGVFLLGAVVGAIVLAKEGLLFEAKRSP